MIYYPLSYALRSEDLPKQSTATASANGQALVSTFTSGVFGVAPSAGAANEKFVGFLSVQTSALPFAQTVAVNVEQATLSVSGTYTLQQVPVSSSYMLYDNTAGAIVSSGYTIDAYGNLTYAAGAGHLVTVTYQVALTVAQAAAKFGNIQPGGYFGDYVGSWTVMREGTIYTDQFDTTVDYSVATSIKTAAGGKVTSNAGTTSAPAISANVVSIPTNTRPFLGLSFIAY